MSSRFDRSRRGKRSGSIEVSEICALSGDCSDVLDAVPVLKFRNTYGSTRGLKGAIPGRKRGEKR